MPRGGARGRWTAAKTATATTSESNTTRVAAQARRRTATRRLRAWGTGTRICFSNLQPIIIILRFFFKSTMGPHKPGRPFYSIQVESTSNQSALKSRRSIDHRAPRYISARGSAAAARRLTHQGGGLTLCTRRRRPPQRIHKSNPCPRTDCRGRTGARKWGRNHRRCPASTGQPHIR